MGAVLFGDASVKPLGGPVCDVIAIAKRDLSAGTQLDGIGGFTVYGTIENSPAAGPSEPAADGPREGCVLSATWPRTRPHVRRRRAAGRAPVRPTLAGAAADLRAKAGVRSSTS